MQQGDTVQPAALGTHLIAELWDCDPQRLNDLSRIQQGLLAAAQRGGMQVIAVKVHAFAPHGVTGVVLLAESHLSIHTWPEYGYAAVDIFCCSGDPLAALDEMRAWLGSTTMQVRTLLRGSRD